MAGKLPGRAFDSNTSITVNSISLGSNLAINTTAVSFGNSTVNTTVNSSVITVGANVSVNTSTITLGNSTVNTVIHTTGFTGNGAGLHTVNAAALQGNSVSDILVSANTAANTLASAAYSNAIAYSGNAALAYANATSYTDTKAGDAFTNAASRADSAYSNAIAYSGNAVQAYNNAIAYAASNTYVNNTFLPLAGGTLTGNLTINATANVVSNLAANNVVIRGDIQIDGNLTVSGTSVTLNAASLAVEDNMIYLNNGSQVSHPDLGFAGNYNDGTYRHAGFFRDATDATWKVFDSYQPEPDASAYIDTSNNTFRIANFQANVITANSFTGNGASITSVDAATVGGNTAATLRSYSDTVAATAYSNGTSYADTKAATAYSNAISYSGNAALAYSNAVTYASNATNISSGTVAFARLPALYLGTTQIQSSSAAQAVSGITTLAAGNTTITGFANVTTTLQVGTNTATFGTAAYIIANGNVGIGYATPDQPLAFADSVGVKIQFNGNNTNGYQVGLASSVAGADAMMKFTAGEVGAGEFGFYNTTNLRVLIAANGNVGVGNSTPAHLLRVQGTASFNGDVTLTAGKLVINDTVGADGELLRVGDDTYFGDTDTTGTLGLYNLGDTTKGALKLGSSGGTLTGNNNSIGINQTAPGARLHVTTSAPGGVGGVPSGTGIILENNANNFLTFRHSADSAFYSGIAFLDNNIGGYVVHGDSGNYDGLYIAGYSGVRIQSGTHNGVSPDSRTTVLEANVAGLRVATGNVVISSATGSILFSDSSQTKRGMAGTTASDDYWFVGGGSTAYNAGFAEISTGDDGTEPIYARQYSGAPLTGTVSRTFTMLDASGDTVFHRYQKDRRGYTLSHSYDWHWLARRYDGYAGDIRTNINSYFWTTTSTPLDSQFLHTDDLNAANYIGENIWGDVHNYRAWAITYIYVERAFTITNATLNGDDPYALYIDKVYVTGSDSCCSGVTYSYTFLPGWRRIELIYSEGGGGHYVSMGWNPKNYTANIKAMTPFGPASSYG